jgi:hypothetical protein
MNQFKTMLLLTAVLIILSTKSLFAQDMQDKPFEEKGTIEKQFSYVFDKSYTFEIYKSIRIAWFQTLKSHVLDSLKNIRKELRSTQMLVQAKSDQLDSLKSEFQKTNEKLDKITKEKNSFRLMGILMSKIAYNSLLWTIILVLAGGLIIFILLFKRSYTLTSEAQTSLNELKDEFETFRKRSLEREEKMARKHLDELNKYKK